MEWTIWTIIPRFDDRCHFHTWVTWPRPVGFQIHQEKASHHPISFNINFLHSHSKDLYLSRLYYFSPVASPLSLISCSFSNSSLLIHLAPCCRPAENASISWGNITFVHFLDWSKSPYPSPISRGMLLGKALHHSFERMMSQWKCAFLFLWLCDVTVVLKAQMFHGYFHAHKKATCQPTNIRQWQICSIWGSIYRKASLYRIPVRRGKVVSSRISLFLNIGGVEHMFGLPDKPVLQTTCKQPILSV